MRLGTPRNPAIVLLLCFLTCGLYYFYLVYVISAETRDFLGETEINMEPGLEVLLTLVTFGLWNIYWDYRMGKRMAQMCRMVGLPATDNAILYLVLDLLGVGIINALLEQDTLNRIWKAAQFGPGPQGLSPQNPPPGPSWPAQPPNPQSNSEPQSWHSSSPNQTPRQPRPPRQK